MDSGRAAWRRPRRRTRRGGACYALRRHARGGRRRATATDAPIRAPRSATAPRPVAPPPRSTPRRARRTTAPPGRPRRAAAWRETKRPNRRSDRRSARSDPAERRLPARVPSALSDSTLTDAAGAAREHARARTARGFHARTPRCTLPPFARRRAGGRDRARTGADDRRRRRRDERAEDSLLGRTDGSEFSPRRAGQIADGNGYGPGLRGRGAFGRPRRGAPFAAGDSPPSACGPRSRASSRWRGGFETVGFVGYDEHRTSHIHTRVEGWIDRLSVRAVGRSHGARRPAGHAVCAPRSPSPAANCCARSGAPTPPRSPARA